MAQWLWPVNWYVDLLVFGIALCVDLLLGEPPNALHPVAWFGWVVGWLERRLPKEPKWPALAAGLLLTVGAMVVFAAAAGWAAYGALQLGTWAYVVVAALLLKCSFSVRLLTRSGLSVSESLQREELAEARLRIGRLVSRKTERLTRPQIASAAIETVVENTTDSFIAPWLAFAVLGLPGAFAYRAINTLDSMIGFRGRFERLGKAAARLDDLVNLVPARVSALLLLVAGARLGFQVRAGFALMRREHALTASPNAGWTMGAVAGLLGVELVKPGYYRLGAGQRVPEATDVLAAVRCCYLVAAFGALLALGLLFLRYAVV